jgi:hypothetical protein
LADKTCISYSCRAVSAWFLNFPGTSRNRSRLTEYRALINLNEPLSIQTMNKFTRVKLALTTLSLALLSSCSSNLYTFAPNTGSYHGTEKKAATVVAKEETAPEMVLAQAATSTAQPAEIEMAHAQAATALSQAYAAKKSAVKENNSVSATEKKDAKRHIKQLHQGVKDVKAKIKKSTGLGLSNNVKLLLILGLAFILVGALLNVGIIYTIGAILLIIALVLLLMEIL